MCEMIALPHSIYTFIYILCSASTKTGFGGVDLYYSVTHNTPPHMTLLSHKLILIATLLMMTNAFTSMLN